MLEWGRELGSSIAAESAADEQRPSSDAAAIAAWTDAQLTLQQDAGGEVLVLVWPGGRILRVPRGTTAGARRRGQTVGGSRLACASGKHAHLQPSSAAAAQSTDPGCHVLLQAL